MTVVAAAWVTVAAATAKGELGLVAAAQVGLAQISEVAAAATGTQRRSCR